MTAIRQAYRYELDPNNRQRGYLGRCCGMARYVYNWGLRDRVERYEANEGTARFVSFFDQCRAWTTHRDAAAAWARELPAGLALCALKNLDQAFANFRRRLKVGGAPGFPKFKSRRHGGRFQIACGAIRPVPGGVWIPKLGVVRVKETPELPDGAVIKTSTVTETASGKWFVSLLVERERALPEPPATPPVLGLHCGLAHFATLSDGTRIEHPRPLRQALDRLAMLQRRMARRTNGSAGWREARLAVARQHERVADQRRDFLHKVSTRLVQRRVRLVVEQWDLPGIAADPRFARLVADAGIGEFHLMLGYKAPWHGAVLCEAPPGYPSSQTCSRCHYVRTGEDKLAVGLRTYVCPQCGLELDRELNAARNLAYYGTASAAGTDARGEDSSEAGTGQLAEASRGPGADPS